MTSGPRKVLFVASDFNIGGAETLLLRLLQGFNPNRIMPFFASLAPEGTLEKRLPPGLNVRRFERKHRYDLSPARQIAKLIQEENIDVVLALGIFAFLFVKIARFRLRRPLRVYISYHLTKPRSVTEFWSILTYARLIGAQDTVVTVCQAQASYLARTFRVPEERFQTIYNGIDTAYWTFAPPEFNRSAAREEWSIPSDAYVIVKVARLRPEKRHDDALRALAEVHRTHGRKPYLMIVGDGDPAHEQRLRALAASLGVIDYVRFCGAHDDVRAFYWMADLFTLTSMSETFSVALLEAMATGLPAVMTDVGGTREIIREGMNGLWVPPGNPHAIAEAWVRIMNSRVSYVPERIRAFIQENFVFQRCLQSYEDLLSRNGKRP